MRQIKTPVFILEKEPQSKDEGRLLVLSRKYGFLRLTAAGLYKRGAKLGALSDPPILATAGIFLNADSMSGRLITLSDVNHLSHFKENYCNYLWFSFLIYLLKTFTQGESGVGKYFTLLVEIFSDEKAWKEEDKRNLNIIYFVLRLLEREGFDPSINDCFGCGKKFESNEKSYYCLGDQGVICQQCLRKVWKNLQFRKDISFDYLNFTPLTENIPWPKESFRISEEVRVVILTAQESADLKNFYAKIFLSPKINRHLILQSRNFLLYFLASLI